MACVLFLFMAILSCMGPFTLSASERTGLDLDDTFHDLRGSLDELRQGLDGYATSTRYTGAAPTFGIVSYNGTRVFENIHRLKSGASNSVSSGPLHSTFEAAWNSGQSRVGNPETDGVYYVIVQAEYPLAVVETEEWSRSTRDHDYNGTRGVWRTGGSTVSTTPGSFPYEKAFSRMDGSSGGQGGYNPASYYNANGRAGPGFYNANPSGTYLASPPRYYYREFHLQPTNVGVTAPVSPAYYADILADQFSLPSSPKRSLESHFLSRALEYTFQNAWYGACSYWTRQPGKIVFPGVAIYETPTPGVSQRLWHYTPGWYSEGSQWIGHLSVITGLGGYQLDQTLRYSAPKTLKLVRGDHGGLGSGGSTQGVGRKLTTPIFTNIFMRTAQAVGFCLPQPQQIGLGGYTFLSDGQISLTPGEKGWTSGFYANHNPFMRNSALASLAASMPGSANPHGIPTSMSGIRAVADGVFMLSNYGGDYGHPLNPTGISPINDPMLAPFIAMMNAHVYQQAPVIPGVNGLHRAVQHPAPDMFGTENFGYRSSRGVDYHHNYVLPLLLGDFRDLLSGVNALSALVLDMSFIQGTWVEYMFPGPDRMEHGGLTSRYVSVADGNYWDLKTYEDVVEVSEAFYDDILRYRSDPLAIPYSFPRGTTGGRSLYSTTSEPSTGRIVSAGSWSNPISGVYNVNKFPGRMAPFGTAQKFHESHFSAHPTMGSIAALAGIIEYGGVGGASLEPLVESGLQALGLYAEVGEGNLRSYQVWGSAHIEGDSSTYGLNVSPFVTCCNGGASLNLVQGPLFDGWFYRGFISERFAEGGNAHVRAQYDAYLPLQWHFFRDGNFEVSGLVEWMETGRTFDVGQEGIESGRSRAYQDVRDRLGSSFTPPPGN